MYYIKEVPETLEGRIECDEIEIQINQNSNSKLTRKPCKKSGDFVSNTGDKATTVVQVVAVIDEKNQLYLLEIEAKRIAANHL